MKVLSILIFLRFSNCIFIRVEKKHAMTAKIKKKGIYCIEGLWDHGNIQDETTVLPILDFLDKWKHKAINEKYPILYLAFHGDPGYIFLTHKDKYSLAQLADFLEISAQVKSFTLDHAQL